MTQISWKNGWKLIVDSDYKARLLDELGREIANNHKHVLFGKRVDFIAEWDGSREKDFVVCISEDSFATVHLTYSVEHDASWPWTTLIGNRRKLQDYIDHD
jgi:hypothetical protein